MTGDKERIEVAKWLFERTLHWIAAADAKVAVAVAVNTAMLGGLAAAYASSDAGARTAWCMTFVWSSSSGLILATFFAALAAIPRMQGPVKSMIFFGRVAERTVDDYVLAFQKLTEQDFLDDLTTQIYRNSQIARDKHTWVRKSLYASFISAVGWAVGVALLVRG